MTKAPPQNSLSGTRTTSKHFKMMKIAVALLIFTQSVCCQFAAASASPPYDGKVRREADGSESAYMIAVAHTSHASTIEILPDGSLAAAWFSGEHEEASDLAIVFSVLNGGKWSKPQIISERDGYANQTQFYSMISYTKLFTCTIHKQKLKVEKASNNLARRKQRSWKIVDKTGFMVFATR